MVLSLDRLGRNSYDLTDIIETIRHRGAQLNVLNLPSFASIEDPNLRNLITTIIVELYKYIAQEERETIKIRQQQGIGKYKGKIREYGPHSPNRQKRYIYKEACRLLNRKKDGDETLTKRQIARMLGIAPVTLYRIEKYQAEDLANVPRSER